MPSPVRRSTRGAPPTTAKPPPPASTASSSSLSSSRQDRVAKLNNNAKSATPQSRSSEEMSEPPRRSQRSHPPKEEEAVKDSNGVDEDVGEEEEITRCICGQQDYPGPPLSEAFGDVDAQGEEAGGLFISCDGCSVWQHGGCVGIIEDSQVPDKYYCEECRPKFHELHTDSRGQRYSLYQPVNGKPNRKTSMSKHGESAQKERETTVASRGSADPGPGKRRATMRSKEHDEEEEQFLRALEESKREVAGASNGRRNGKRVRDDSEDSKHDSKRQRRTSEAQPSSLRRTAVEDDSADEPTAGGRLKKSRAEAAQSARQAELHEKGIERERARAEAAGRRQERAGRRRADDEADEDTPKLSASAKTSPPPSSQPGSPPAENATEKVSHKKGPGKRTKKLGNNQYTNRNRDMNSTSSPYGKKRNTSNNQGTSSGEEQVTNGDAHAVNGGTGTGKNSPEHGGNGVKGKFGKGKHKAVNGNGGKHDDPADLTIANMKRRMEAMTAYIARAQMELTGDRTPSGTNSVPVEDAGMAGGAVQPLSANGNGNGKKFEEMNAMEMADEVSRNINSWHQKFDHLA